MFASGRAKYSPLSILLLDLQFSSFLHISLLCDVFPLISILLYPCRSRALIGHSSPLDRGVSILVSPSPRPAQLPLHKLPRIVPTGSLLIVYPTSLFLLYFLPAMQAEDESIITSDGRNTCGYHVRPTTLQRMGDPIPLPDAGCLT